MIRKTKRLWGKLGGKDIWLFSLENSNLRASVSNLGGVLQSLNIQDRNGSALDVVLGYDTPDEYYRDDCFFGAMIGPIADRMAGGRCVLDGQSVSLTCNAGPDSMHSGPEGFHRQVWDWASLPDGIAFTRDFGEGALGFPGRLRARLSYRLTAGDTLRLEYSAQCDRETAVSFTNHTYFNLAGSLTDCRRHRLTVYAQNYAETEREADPIVTGRLLPVEGTPLDFRTGRFVGDAVDRTAFAEIRSAGGVDHYFAVEGEGFRPMAALDNPENGVKLLCRSDAPGLLVYTGNGLKAVRGKNGTVYARNGGVCLETGRFPNAVNLPERREAVLIRPGEIYETATEFVFAR